MFYAKKEDTCKMNKLTKHQIKKENDKLNSAERFKKKMNDVQRYN